MVRCMLKTIEHPAKLQEGKADLSQPAATSYSAISYMSVRFTLWNVGFADKKTCSALLLFQHQFNVSE